MTAPERPVSEQAEDLANEMTTLTEEPELLYFANPTSNRKVHAAMGAGNLGFIDTPRQGNKRPEGITWCADNGCFGKGFDEQQWWAWLVDNANQSSHCLFATAPDVVGDAAATLERSRPWLPKIRELGYPAAFVAQDGQENLPVPWDEFDVLFIGGSTKWKLGPQARGIVAEANRRGKHVHMGRVNSRRRYQYAQAIGCDSVDGTFLVFGPEVNLPRLMSWVDEAASQEELFAIEADRYRWGH
ncbi:hypothetical protein [Mycolicibacterium fortuitum]